MLLAALKILLFFALVLAVTLGAVHLAETDHTLRLVFGGQEYTLGPLTALVALVVVVLLGWLVIRLLALTVAFLRFLMGDDTAINRYFARSRERKGYAALSEGMLAVASGEGALAQAKAAKAAKFLDSPHITDLLAAQAAEVAGDHDKATEVYRRLLGDDRTRFVGVRGLMRQKLEQGDTQTALKLAQKAYALKPKNLAVQDTLLQLQTSQGDWHGARAVLKDKRKQGELPTDVYIRRDAVLALKEASEVLAAGNSISAREAAISANRASPDLIPAAVLAARSYIAQGDTRNASRVLQKTWSVRPHPSIAATYAEIVPDETPSARLRRFEDLMRKNPGDEETHLLRAELLLAVEDFPGARRALGNIPEKHPTVRSLSIQAAVERGEGSDDAVVRGLLAKAMLASRGSQWVCDKCHNVMADWAPTCDSCGSFDTLTWREPDNANSLVATPNGVELLPLLIGAPAPAADVDQSAVSPDLTKAKTAADDGPKVAPGMVPREFDYPDTAAKAPSEPTSKRPRSDDDPSMTVTDPEPEVVSKPVEAAPKPKDAVAEPAATVDEPLSSRPSDVLPAPERIFEKRTPAGPQLVDEAEILPVRPDVEPLEDEPPAKRR